MTPTKRSTSAPPTSSCTSAPRYLRAVADHLWLGPGFAALLPIAPHWERVAVVTAVGDTLAVERRPEATLRDLELSLEPMLATQADSQAFWDRFSRPRRQ